MEKEGTESQQGTRGNDVLIHANPGMREDVSIQRVREYCNEHCSEIHPILQELREATSTSSITTRYATMVAGPSTTSFIEGLIRMGGHRKIMEVGVFTGYTTLGMALAGGPDTKITACDISDEFTSLGKPFWKKAGVEENIDLRIGKAADTMDTLLADGHEGTYDLVFIDADKTGYLEYYEKSVELLRQNGVIVIDNSLWHGKVIDESVQDVDTVCIRATVKRAQADNRVHTTLLSVDDGITMCVKK